MDEKRLRGRSVFDKGFPCQQNDVCKSMLGFDKGFPCQWRSENKPRLTRETLVNVGKEVARDVKQSSMEYMKIDLFLRMF